MKKSETKKEREVTAKADMGRIDGDPLLAVEGNFSVMLEKSCKMPKWFSGLAPANC